MRGPDRKSETGTLSIEAMKARKRAGGDAGCDQRQGDAAEAVEPARRQGWRSFQQRRIELRQARQRGAEDEGRDHDQMARDERFSDGRKPSTVKNISAARPKARPAGSAAT